MPADSPNGFQSVLSACMEKFLQEKHACGYAYRESIRIFEDSITRCDSGFPSP